LEKFLRSATFPFWLMAMRPCVAMSTDQEVWAGPLSPSLLNRHKKKARG
jgi:hypothetical protein